MKKDKKYYEKEWKKKHSKEMTLKMFIFLILIFVCLYFKSIMIFVVCILAIIWCAKKYYELDEYVKKSLKE